MRNSPRASQCKRFDMGVKMEYDKHTEIIYDTQLHYER